MTKQYRFGFILALAFAAWTNSAGALEDSDKEAVRVLSNEAASDFDQHRYDAALEKFTRAYRLAPVPKLAVWAARANEKLGHLVAAYELYLQALGFQPSDLWKGDTQQQAQKDAEDELGKLQPRIPKLTIIVEGAKFSEVSVKVDGKQVPSDLLGVERLADPGQREVVGKRGDEVVNQTVTLAEDKKKQVALRFRDTSARTAAAPAATMSAAPTAQSSHASPQSNGIAQQVTTSVSSVGFSSVSPAADQSSPRASTERTLGWAGVGVGAGALALGAATGLFVALKHGDLSTQCPVNNDCFGRHTTEVNTYNAMRTVSVVGFVVGGVASAAGLTLLLVTPKEKSLSRVGLWLSPNAAAISGDF